MGIAEILHQQAIIGAQNARTRNDCQCNNVGVVGCKGGIFRDSGFLAVDVIVIRLVESPCSFELCNEPAKPLYAKQFCSEATAEYKAAALEYPVNDEAEVWIRPARDGRARSIGVNNNAHP